MTYQRPNRPLGTRDSLSTAMIVLVPCLQACTNEDKSSELNPLNCDGICGPGTSCIDGGCARVRSTDPLNQGDQSFIEPDMMGDGGMTHSADFSLGLNPLNLSWTTGLGDQPMYGTCHLLG